MVMALMSFSESGGIQRGIDLATPYDRSYPAPPIEKYRYTPIEPPKPRRTKYKKRKNRAGK